MSNGVRGALRTWPFNLNFWTAVILFFLCLKQKKQFVKLLLFALIVQCVIMAVLFFL